MATFKDNQGLVWIIKINVSILKQIRTELGVDLANDDGNKTIGKLADDPILLTDVIYIICRSQAVERSISDEDFGRDMAGESIADACTAFMEELANFFPSPAKRRALKIMQETIEKAEAKMMQSIDKPEMAAAIEKALDELIFGKQSTTSQASSALIPTL